LWPPSPLSGTLSTHLHSSTCPPCRRCMSLMSSRLSHSSTCPQRNPYTRRRLRCRHSDRQPGHLVILRYKRMRAVAYARCIALFVLLVPALRTPAVIPLALAASRIRACMQQDATGSLGTCVHTRMRACQHMLRSAGEKGGSAADTLSTHLSHLSTCPRRTGCTSRQMMKMTRGSRTCPPRMRSQSTSPMSSRLSHSSTFPPRRRCTRRLTAQTQAECGG
jgi:hypothetical protein